LSERHHDAIVSAEALYGAGRFQDAIDRLVPAYADEPDNQFVAEAYGKALYRIGRREDAFPIYEQLVKAVDERMATKVRDDPDSRANIFIDAWLIDAYWKKGTLHMDRGEWDKAAFEISRAYAQLSEPPIVDQALSYQFVLPYLRELTKNRP
jgi:tetratricopeptide (TPR) repeat protein